MNTSETITILYMTLENKISNQDKILLLDRYKNIDENILSKIKYAPLKNPIIGVVLQGLCPTFGVGRFYKGGIISIIAGISYVFLSIMSCFIALVGLGNEYVEIFLFGLCCFLIVYLVGIVDTFFVYKGIQKDNFNKVLAYLQKEG